jgi:HEAT repeat protein
MPSRPGAPSQFGRAVAERRAAVALAGRAGDETAVRHALDDEEPAVRAGALAALVQMGSARPTDAARAIADPSPVVRRAACELAPRLPGAEYARLLGDPEPSVVEAASFALGETGGSGAVMELSQVALRHDDPICRESAVAALGAIGDERGLPAVLAALDGPPALRRRAVVALAAFGGDEVDAALRRAGTDRDWQVRQAAAAVLGEGPDGD